MISIVVISKDEPDLDLTLNEIARQIGDHGIGCETLVVDASSGRLSEIRARHPSVQWIEFPEVPGKVTIAAQRNVGVRAASGEIVVFTDSGCVPDRGWLQRLTASIVADEESVASGRTMSRGDGLQMVYDQPVAHSNGHVYLEECPTINLAFRKDAFGTVGGFDERFAYGSDVDFTWRLVDAGFRIRHVPEAVVRHDYGGPRRQLKRAYTYGRARARLYRKHRHRLPRSWSRDPTVPLAFAYVSYLVALPLAFVWPSYLALLGIPLWRNRRHQPLWTVVDHMAFSVGVVRELIEGSAGA
jgi:GT2 family glycosyltransferase